MSSEIDLVCAWMIQFIGYNQRAGADATSENKRKKKIKSFALNDNWNEWISLLDRRHSAAAAVAAPNPSYWKMEMGKATASLKRTTFNIKRLKPQIRNNAQHICFGFTPQPRPIVAGAEQSSRKCSHRTQCETILNRSSVAESGRDWNFVEIERTHTRTTEPIYSLFYLSLSSRASRASRANARKCTKRNFPISW